MAATIHLSQQHSCSFDHLVGKRKQLGRNVKAERLGSFAVKHKFELVYLLNRQLRRP